ncbi:hypothetical protein ACFE04_011345 [Oxalis oulophora]
MVYLMMNTSIIETIPAIPTLFCCATNPRNNVATIFRNNKSSDGSQKQQQVINRRVALSIGSSLSLFLFSGISLAEEENKYWRDDFPLPVPFVKNNIANEKTGTRSFIKKGLDVIDIGVKSRKYRIRKYAFDLLAMADLIGPDTLNYVHKYLRQKSTFMYYDFDKVISAASLDDQKPLTDLANRLFDNMEQLEDAAKLRKLSQTQSSYKDMTVILQEVMDRMAQLYYQPEAGFTSKITL